MWAGLVRGRARLRVRDRDEVGVERCQVWVGLRDDCKGHVEHGAHLSRVSVRVRVSARVRARARVRVRVAHLGDRREIGGRSTRDRRGGEIGGRGDRETYAYP